MMKSRRTLYPVFIGAFLIAIISACKIYYTPQKIESSISTNAGNAGDGKRLTQLMCAPCHYDQSTQKLTGIRMLDMPKIIGKVYATNITQDTESGIGKYSDAELIYLIRTGIAKDGKLMPYMQRPNLADEDLKSIIAFLHSDDAMVQPSDIDNNKTKYTLIGKFGISKFPGPLPFPEKPVTNPDIHSNKADFGKYLVDNLGCYECHSSDIKKIDKLEPEHSKGFMGGGFKMPNGAGTKITTSNLTFHETGLENWNEADFIKAMKEGMSKDNSLIRYPMPDYSILNNEEISAIYSYLKTIPEIGNKISKSN